MKKNLFFALAFAVTAIFTGCSKTDNALIIATEPTFPPYEYIVGNEICGIDIDIAAEVAKKLGRPLRVENTAFDSIITHVVTGKAHAGASGITVTEERKQQVLYSKPYVTASQVIIVMANNKKINGTDDLKGVRIGCQQGTTGYDYVSENIVKEKASDKLQSFANAALAVEALKIGKLDAVVIDEGPARTFAEQNKGIIRVLDKPLTSEEYAIALNKKDTELCAAFNEVITELIESGRMAEITKKNKEKADKLGQK